MVYDKYLKNNDRVDENVKNIVKNIIPAIKIINNIINVRNNNLSASEIQKVIDSSVKDINKILKSYDTKPVYRDMIRCGLDSALRNINTNNRTTLGY